MSVSTAARVDDFMVLCSFVVFFTVDARGAEMYRVHCIRRADKENAVSFMLRSLLLWTKMLSFSRERGGK